MFETISAARLSNKDFQKLKKVVESALGIKMPETKIQMLEARLRKRLKHLNINSYSEYCDYLFSEEGQINEMVHMMDVTTTNKTDFFREPQHFDFLSKTALPDIENKFQITFDKKLKVWSAGCSTGEEPYTLGMVLSEHKSSSINFDYDIFASDISTKVLEEAGKGIYDFDRIAPVPFELRKKYLLKSKDPEKRLVKVIPELKKKVQLQRLNLITDEFFKNGKFHIIFCRNVMIYFEKENQRKLIEKFYDVLESGGYLFIGHSETLLTVDLPLAQRAPSVYQKK